MSKLIAKTLENLMDGFDVYEVVYDVHTSGGPVEDREWVLAFDMIAAVYTAATVITDLVKDNYAKPFTIKLVRQVSDGPLWIRCPDDEDWSENLDFKQLPIDSAKEALGDVQQLQRDV
jgi:hypothetical protein